MWWLIRGGADMKAFVFLLFISFFFTVQAVVLSDETKNSIEAIVFWAKDIALFKAVKEKKCQELKNALGDYSVAYRDFDSNRLVLVLKEKKQEKYLEEAATQLVFNKGLEATFKADTVEEVPSEAKFYLYSCLLPDQAKNKP